METSAPSRVNNPNSMERKIQNSASQITQPNSRIWGMNRLSNSIPLSFARGVMLKLIIGKSAGRMSATSTWRGCEAKIDSKPIQKHKPLLLLASQWFCSAATGKAKLAPQPNLGGNFQKSCVKNKYANPRRAITMQTLYSQASRRVVFESNKLIIFASSNFRDQCLIYFFN